MNCCVVDVLVDETVEEDREHLRSLGAVQGKKPQEGVVCDRAEVGEMHHDPQQTLAESAHVDPVGSHKGSELEEHACETRRERRLLLYTGDF